MSDAEAELFKALYRTACKQFGDGRVDVHGGSSISIDCTGPGGPFAHGVRQQLEEKGYEVSNKRDARCKNGYHPDKLVIEIPEILQEVADNE